ncbi:CalY family protein [Candidatus Contubernalis alkaliaceticus]|uniref:CalY family protein n=1 Tax=Candidatus Contubernalis alkaliaceticus TaxID=338645 RepID=UPI001F4BDD06|nr:CalY family protein [Candidatus Contubernalis alkalaceticus]UNC93468.1 hypothetical protein HUE98_16115 [Candidatus Contubernalis alkalaceticus]
MNRKMLTSMLIIVMAIAAMAGGTLAWFTYETGAIDNTFVAGTVEIDADETVIAEGFDMLNWNPGDCAKKIFTIENKGSKRVALRGNITMEWFEDVEGDWVSWVPEDVDFGAGVFNLGAAKVSICDESDTPGFDPADWELVYDEDDEIFYFNYKGVLDGTFGGTPETAVLCIKVCLDGPNADNVYQGKKFVLSAKFQAIQASHDDQWNWDEFGSYND